MYKEIVEKLPQETKTMQKLAQITDEFVESVKTTLPQKYADFIQKVQKLADGHHFTDQTLMDSYNHIPCHYDLDDTKRLACDFEIDFTKEIFNKYDFNYAINLMYHTFKALYCEEHNKYVELALAWLDTDCGKAWKHYKKIILDE